MTVFMKDGMTAFKIEMRLVLAQTFKFILMKRTEDRMFTRCAGFAGRYRVFSGDGFHVFKMNDYVQSTDYLSQKSMTANILQA